MTARTNLPRLWSRRPLPIGTVRLRTDGRPIIKVGKGHHLADSAGWAAQARVEMEKVLGRRLTPDEDVWHRDGLKSRNNPDNLVLVPATIPPRVRR